MVLSAEAYLSFQEDSHQHGEKGRIPPSQKLHYALELIAHSELHDARIGGKSAVSSEAC